MNKGYREVQKDGRKKNYDEEEKEKEEGIRISNTNGDTRPELERKDLEC